MFLLRKVHRGNTDDFVRADEMQQHSESTKDVFRKEQEGSTEDQKYIDFDDNDKEEMSKVYVKY